MAGFVCPVCSGELIKTENTYRCATGHSYDIARQGYVNLLRSQQSSKKHHGDDKLMVIARQKFLSKGYYLPLSDAISDIAVKYCPGAPAILDAGCGEGWYTANVTAALREAGKVPGVIGIDISKDALKAACQRCKDAHLAVASAYDLPLADASQDMVLSIFAPLADGEFRRVVKSGGYFVRAVPGEEHLFGLKERIYEKPYLNDPVETELYGFELCEEVKVDYELHLSMTEDILALFMMTPYYYKTGAEDQKKVLTMKELDTQIRFRVLVYKRV